MTDYPVNSSPLRLSHAPLAYSQAPVVYQAPPVQYVQQQVPQQVQVVQQPVQVVQQPVQVVQQPVQVVQQQPPIRGESRIGNHKKIFHQLYIKYIQIIINILFLNIFLDGSFLITIILVENMSLIWIQ
jgi:hypothetical protein